MLGGCLMGGLMGLLRLIWGDRDLGLLGLQNVRDLFGEMGIWGCWGCKMLEMLLLFDKC